MYINNIKEELPVGSSVLTHQKGGFSWQRNPRPAPGLGEGLNSQPQADWLSDRLGRNSPHTSVKSTTSVKGLVPQSGRASASEPASSGRGVCTEQTPSPLNVCRAGIALVRALRWLIAVDPRAGKTSPLGLVCPETSVHRASDSCTWAQDVHSASCFELALSVFYWGLIQDFRIK